MMMTFVNMEAPGITILPTHRVLHGLKGFNPRDFAKAAQEYFTVEELPQAADAATLLVRLINERRGVRRRHTRGQLPAHAAR